MHKKIWNKIISYILILSLILGQNELQVFANNDDLSADNIQQQDSSVADVNNDTDITNMISEAETTADIVEEVVENRTEFTKEYLLSDNSRAIVAYQNQVHYENEEGEFEEIDNS